MGSVSITPTERLLRRERAITATGLFLLAGLSWAYLLTGAGTGMNPLAMTTWEFPPPAVTSVANGWSLGYWLVVLAMWWIMMIAMMVPSAAPMILLYARVVRHAQSRGRIEMTGLPTFIFASGYLTAWLGFSVLATFGQWALERAGLLNQALMWSSHAGLTGLLLIVAGLYQFSPLKQVCLDHCRSPADYLARHWRNGRGGAFQLGARHGIYCLGCCWALMALLFAGGVMNLVWIGGLAALVLIEKLAPWGRTLGLALAVIMAAAGCWLLVQHVWPGT